VLNYQKQNLESRIISHQYITDNDEIVGFLRLRTSNDSGKFVIHKKDGSIKEKITVFDELVNTAMIRELHVYGEAINVNRCVKSDKKSDRTQQHIGFGRRLLNNALCLAKSLGYSRISVISGVGVKPYYRRAGFNDGKYFLLRNIDLNKFSPEFTIDQIIHKVQRFDTNSFKSKQLKNNKKLIKNVCIVAIIIMFMFFFGFRMYLWNH
jgi:GNAT superfamily N-acetyltransferase